MREKRNIATLKGNNPRRRRRHRVDRQGASLIPLPIIILIATNNQLRYLVVYQSAIVFHLTAIRRFVYYFVFQLHELCKPQKAHNAAMAKNGSLLAQDLHVDFVQPWDTRSVCRYVRDVLQHYFERACSRISQRRVADYMTLTAITGA